MLCQAQFVAPVGHSVDGNPSDIEEEMDIERSLVGSHCAKMQVFDV